MGTNTCEIDLDIANLRQRRRSSMCGPTCLQMILDWYGYEASNWSLKKAMRFRNGATECGMVLGLQEFGFDSMCYAMPGGKLIPGKYAYMDQNELVRVLKIRSSKTKDKDLSRSFAELAEAVEYDLVIFAIPTQFQIEIDLVLGYPWIIGVECATLYPELEFNNPSEGHFVILQGFNGKEFIVNDPCHDCGGIHYIKKERVMAAIYRLEGSGVCIYGEATQSSE